MLQFLIAEPNQRFERDLVAEPVIMAQFQHLGIDEALDQPKDIGVRSPLDLADESLFAGRQGREGGSQRKPIRKELVGSIEAAPRITSSSTCHRTRLDVSTQRAYRSAVEILSIAFIVHFLCRSHAPAAGRSGRPMPSCRLDAIEEAMTGAPGDMTETPDP